MNFEYSKNFKLYGTDGNEIPLKYTNNNELTLEINKHIGPNINLQPIYKYGKIEVSNGMLKPCVEMVKLYLISMV